MSRLQTARIKPSTLAIAVSATLGVAGCTDSRTPYETYVACDQEIAAAGVLDDILSCYTKDRQQWLHAQAPGNPQWFQGFKDARPVIARLHEEQLENVEDESILLIVGHTRAGQPAGIEVAMHRAMGGWKIDYEEARAHGAIGSESTPARVSLKPVDGAEWYPGELAGQAGQGPDGTCGLGISHPFQFPRIGITSDCENFATPGTYPLDLLTPDGAEKADSRRVTFWDHRHYSRKVESGQLTITAAENGRIAGEFHFDTTDPSRTLSITGTFSNLPFEYGD